VGVGNLVGDPDRLKESRLLASADRHDDHIVVDLAAHATLVVRRIPVAIPSAAHMSNSVRREMSPQPFVSAAPVQAAEFAHQARAVRVL